MSMKSLAMAAIIGFAGLSLSGCVSETGYYEGYYGPGRYYDPYYDRSYYGGGISYDRYYYRDRYRYRRHRDRDRDRPDYNRPDRPDRPIYRSDRPQRQVTSKSGRPIRLEVQTEGGNRRIIVPGAGD